MGNINTGIKKDKITWKVATKNMSIAKRSLFCVRL